MISKAQFSDIHSRLGSQGGFTVNPRTGVSVTEGISVAPMDNERKVPAATSSGADVAAYHSENTDRFSRGASLGGWRFQGTDFLDTPTVYPDSPGGVSRSRRQMLASNQIASYNIGTGQESFNPYHPAVRTDASTGQTLDIVAHDTPEQRKTWAEMPRRVGKIAPSTKSNLREGQSFS